MEQKSSEYGKRPILQWILIYIVVGAIIYGLIYYFVSVKQQVNPYQNQNQEQKPKYTGS